MNKFAISCFLIFMSFSLTGQNTYTIKGTITPKLNKCPIELNSFVGDSIKDTQVCIIENGMFSFSGTENTDNYSEICFRDLSDNNTINYNIVLEKGEINVDIRDFKMEVKGTPLNELMQNFVDSLFLLRLRLITLYEAAQKGEVFGNDVDSAADDFISYSKNFAIQNIQNVVGRRAFFDHITIFPSDNAFYDILSLAPAEIQNDPRVLAEIDRRNEESAKKDKEIKDPLACIGQQIEDFDFFTLEGTSVKLSDYIGKSNYIYLDFWASWCGPCIAEMPELKRVYEQYKDSGLEIIGISSDHHKKNWENAVLHIGMPWIHLSELKVKSPIRDKYGIFGIPWGILLDKNGTIVDVVSLATGKIHDFFKSENK